MRNLNLSVSTAIISALGGMVLWLLIALLPANAALPAINAVDAGSAAGLRARYDAHRDQLANNAFRM